MKSEEDGSLAWRVQSEVGGYTGGKDCRFHVAFKDLEDELDWIDGNWICPHENDEMAVYRHPQIQEGKSSLYWTSRGMKYWLIEKDNVASRMRRGQPQV
ncbi:hypothetical protein K7X08_015541 [Anisodus acutangulus]|uniref:Uncharacterized protein n=1 Tax=Anisodus acutangulus TaxID=402998 RepID=A0A9Q1QUZ6_9SOLA|nr:hypothetical protein K7X08_015541 [Anisodus acutangulus]